MNCCHCGRQLQPGWAIAVSESGLPVCEDCTGEQRQAHQSTWLRLACEARRFDVLGQDLHRVVRLRVPDDRVAFILKSGDVHVLDADAFRAAMLAW